MISLIVAMDKDRVIGVENKLPWHLPADLKRFKELTLGHHMIMGRKTFDSIGRPLPGRTSVIVSRQANYKVEGCKVASSLEAALELSRGDTEIFIIGGGDLFAQALPLADRLYLTEIDLRVGRGDVYFPEISAQAWRETERVTHEPDDKNKFRYTYLTYVKKD